MLDASYLKGSSEIYPAFFGANIRGQFAPVAQRIEHLTTDQKVWGSNPYGRALGKESAVDCVVIQIVIFGLFVAPLA